MAAAAGLLASLNMSLNIALSVTTFCLGGCCHTQAFHDGHGAKLGKASGTECSRAAGCALMQPPVAKYACSWRTLEVLMGAIPNKETAAQAASNVTSNIL